MKRLYPLLACLAFAQVAHAEITATFVLDEAFFGVGSNTWGLQVTTDSDWLAGEIDIEPGWGGLRYESYGFPVVPAAIFSGANDSGVMGKDFFVSPTLEPGWIATDAQLSASWSTAASDEVGTFYIGAFTFRPDANGTISGHVTALNPDDPLAPFVFDLEGWSVVNGAVTHSPVAVPEPSSLAVVGIALAGCVLACRRRTRLALVGGYPCREIS